MLVVPLELLGVRDDFNQIDQQEPVAEVYKEESCEEREKQEQRKKKGKPGLNLLM